MEDARPRMMSVTVTRLDRSFKIEAEKGIQNVLLQ
jgi:hypothetical protein